MSRILLSFGLHKIRITLSLEKVTQPASSELVAAVQRAVGAARVLVELGKRAAALSASSK